MSSLSHHGIKGQKWGVRRFQNKDGTRTALGRKRQAAAQNVYKNQAANMLSEFKKNVKAKGVYGYEKTENEFLKHIENSALVERHNAYVDILNNENEEFAREALKNYYDLSEIHSEMNKMITDRRKTVHSKALDDDNNLLRSNIDSFYKEMTDDQRRKIDDLEELTSIQTMEKKEAPTRKVKHTSIGGTMYIEGNALILGDSSYLEHHGIRGQRWGVRRFQNRDGSLTNAGRKRLGYATKGATQAVKKAFKAGTKTGAKAVKAVKAHYKKAEEKKIEKKKEKASKTRAGVSANKDLFTAKELKELNAKFEEQDKLTMARIKHGVEIAKAVGETAKSVGEVGKAYEALTGHKIVPDIVTLQNGGSIDFGNKDKDKDKDNKDTSKDKGKGNNPSNGDNGVDDDDPPKPPNGGGGGSGDKPNWTNTPPDLPTPQSKSKWGDSDLQSQMEAAKKQASKAMKNAKLQEYIDAYNRDQNSEKNKELAARGQKAIEILSKGGGFNSEAPSSSPSPTPKAAPSSNNLMAQIRAAQAKLEKPNKNETPAEHKEAQKKLNALEKVANEYKAAANKPGTDSAEVAEKLLKKNKDILDDIKHMDFSDETYLEHYGVRGMKWGKHLMAGKGSGIYDGTALGAGGGGGAMTEEERKKAEELRKKKLEEAKKKAEEAAKEKEIEEKAKEIGISAKAYKRYSIDNNRLPGKHHYDKSQKLHSEASSSLAETQAAERQAHTNRAKAASLMRKVNSSHMFDADGYHISQQRGDDRKEAKQLKKEAKQLDKASKKALKKFYKKRYKADKERQKWQNSTSGKYHHMMRHYEIQNGVLFIDSSDYLSHHGVKGQKWGVRRFQNPDGSLTEKGRKHYEKAIEKLDRKQVNSDNRRGALERQHPFAVTASAILTGSAYAALMIASAANPATIALGTSIVAAVSALGTHVDYSVAEAWEARGTKRRKKKRKEYEEMLNHDGMYHVENGTLFIDAGEPYLEHHGVLGMKWGKHLMAGKGVDAEAGGGGGFAEDDEKLKEMAKKAGMSVAEYRNKFASKIGGAAAKVKKEIGYAYGSEHKKDFEKAARLHANNRRSLHEQAKAAWEGYGESRTAAERDNWDRYKEYDRQERASGNMFVKRERSKQAYDNSLASKVDSVKRKARLTQDKAKSKISDAVDAAKKTRDDVKGNIRSKTGIGVKKDIERNARLAEGQDRRAHELTKQVYAAKNKDDWARAYSESNKESFKARDNEHKANKDTKSYPKSIAGRVDSIKRKTSLTKDRLKSTLGKSKQRKQLSTVGPKAKKQINNARDSVEKASRANENAYKHAKAVYRQTGSDSDAYKQAIKRSGTTLQRYIDSKKLLAKKKRAKHSDDTNAIYTEGTRLVVNSKWG